MISLFTREEFDSLCEKDKDYWSLGVSRWPYVEKCLNLIKRLQINSPEKVLEIGPMDVQLVKGSHTMDKPNKIWVPKNKEVTYEHDATHLPWPIQDDRYDLLIALRVWQHLWPFQKECLFEALRIARHILIVAPETYSNGRGIPTVLLVEWTKNIYSEHELVFGDDTYLHYWDKERA